MIPQTFEYSAPKTLDEALRQLNGGDARVLAGGMSLIPMMKLRLSAPEKLVDLGRIAELNYIREAAGALHIGATTTHHALESSPLVLQKCPLLAASAASIGDVQVRNVGTLGGSVAHADPSADYPAALLALDTKVVLKSTAGERTVEAADFFLDAFTTALEPGEIVREVIVPTEEAGTGTAYRFQTQPASGFAIVGIAVRVRKSGGAISFIRVGVTGLSNHAYRAHQVESALLGKAGSAADIQSAAALVADGVDANSDLFASADYRKHLARVFAGRAISAALAGLA
jgi:carbon-monoxide dehydrogenase medium subunit